MQEDVKGIPTNLRLLEGHMRFAFWSKLANKGLLSGIYAKILNPYIGSYICISLGKGLYELSIYASPWLQMMGEVWIYIIQV